MQVSRAAVLLLTSAALAGCMFGDASDRGRVTVRDSAGISIVETSRALWTDSADAWRIDPQPWTEIGLVEGELPYLLDQVIGATRMSDGRIVIASRGTNDLRFFDQKGTFLRSVGGSGGGPGEFEYMMDLYRCGGDSLFAFDIGGRMKIFGPDGEYARQMTISEPGSAREPYQLACSKSGNFVISGWGMREGPPEIGLVRSMTPVWILDSQGDSAATLGQFLGSERIGQTFAQAYGSRPHPFGRTTRFALNAEAVWLGDGTRLEVQRYSPDGRLVAIQRAPTEDLSVTEELVEAYRQHMLASMPEARRPAFERELSEMPMPDGFPAFTEMLVDDAGHLWVQRFQWPGEIRTQWGIFAPDGEFLGYVALPPRFTLMEVGSDYVLGLARDEDGVQRVRLHALQRTERAP